MGKGEKKIQLKQYKMDVAKLVDFKLSKYNT